MTSAAAAIVAAAVALCRRGKLNNLLAAAFLADGAGRLGQLLPLQQPLLSSAFATSAPQIYPELQLILGLAGITLFLLGRHLLSLLFFLSYSSFLALVRQHLLFFLFFSRPRLRLTLLAGNSKHLIHHRHPS